MKINVYGSYGGGYEAVDDNTYCGCPECHHPVGRGKTEQEAIDDLMEQLAEREEA
jgi:hypothetical protein